jgi:DNA-binding NarL/FixJ family response regulator
MKKILIVDDQSVIRTGLKLHFDTVEGFEVVGEARDGAEALRQVALLNPDIVLMDLDMPVMDGLEATARLTMSHPTVIVVILSIHDDPTIREQVRAAGAAAFVAKSDVEKMFLTVQNIAGLVKLKPKAFDANSNAGGKGSSN